MTATTPSCWSVWVNVREALGCEVLERVKWNLWIRLQDATETPVHALSISNESRAIAPKASWFVCIL